MSQDPAGFDGIFPERPQGPYAADGAAAAGARPDGQTARGVDVDTLLGAVAELPYGPQGRALLDDALRVARDRGLDVDEYRIRMHIIAFAQMGGDIDGVLSNFAWCVSHNEADPVRFPTRTDDCDLLWYFKWIPDTLSSNPRFSREDVLAALDSLEQRYRREGVGLSAVYQARFGEARRAGLPAQAEHWRELATTAERDDYSDCEACTRAELVFYFLERDEPESALRAFDEIVEGRLTCAEEPESVMATVLIPLLRAGREADAEQAHRISYRLARENPALTEVFFLHAEFCAVTGNHARALTLIERHLPSLAHDEFDEGAHFSALGPLHVTCRILARAGHGDLAVRGSDAPGVRAALGLPADADGAGTNGTTAPRRLSVAELATASLAAAQRCASAFDRRNGTERYAARLRRVQEESALSFDVPLGSPEQFPTAPAPEPAADDVDGWADRAIWGLVSGDAQGVRNAVRHGLAAGPSPRQALRLWGALADLATDLAHASAAEAVDAGAGDGSESAADPDLQTALLHRSELYAGLGLVEEARFELAHGHLLYDYLDDEEARHVADLLADVESPELRGRIMYVVANFARARGSREAASEGYRNAAEQARAAGDHDTYVRALIGECWTAPVEADHPEELRESMALARAAGPRANQVYDLAYLHAVDALVLDDDPDTALDRARRAADIALANRAPGPLRQVTSFRVDLLTRMNRHAEAARVQHVYNRMLEEADRGVDGDGIVAETRALLLADQPDEAFELIDPVAQQLEDHADDTTPGDLAKVQYWRGTAAEAVGALQLAFGHWWTALEIGESALEAAWESDTDHSDALKAALHASEAAVRLTNLAVQAEEPDDVRRLGRRALALAAAIESFEHSYAASALQVNVGRAFVEIGDAEAGLALLETAEESFTERGSAWPAADARDVRGRALAALGRPDEAIPVLLSAGDGYRAEGDGVNGALSDFAAAVVLRGHERDEEAAVLLSSALEAIKESPGEARTAIATVYAELLDEQGKSTLAREVRGFIE